MRRRVSPARLSIGVAAALALAAAAQAGERPVITLAAARSVESSGLLAAILPTFSDLEGIDVRVVPVSPQRALELGRRGEADVLLLHDRPSEDALLAQHHASERRDVMYDELLIVGPNSDPAHINAVVRATVAFAKIADAGAAFVSGGEDSETHAAELRLWSTAGRDPKSGAGTWYHEASGDAAAVLRRAAELKAYALTDRASWLALESRRGLMELVDGDPHLKNPYGLLVVSSIKHPGAKSAPARKLADWLTGPVGRAAIERYRVRGQQAYFVEESS